MKFFLILLAVLTSRVFAGGIPTFDAASIVQLRLLIDAQQAQFSKLQQQYQAMTGEYGRGHIAVDKIRQATGVMPGTWQDVVRQQANGRFNIQKGQYEQLLKTLPQELFAKQNAHAGTTYRMSTDSVRAAMAGGDALYGSVQTHMQNITHLIGQIDTTKNVKDAADLQSRIAAEKGLMQVALGKLSVMNTNLQANILNQSNQDRALNQRFFSK